MRATLFISCLILAGCGEFPTAGETRDGAGYPEILSISELIVENSPGKSAEEIAEEDELLESRAEALRNRADTIRAEEI